MTAARFALASDSVFVRAVSLALNDSKLGSALSTLTFSLTYTCTSSPLWSSLLLLATACPLLLAGVAGVLLVAVSLLPSGYVYTKSCSASSCSSLLAVPIASANFIPILTGLSAGSSARSHNTRQLSCTPQCRLKSLGSRGAKWAGAHDLDTQVASDAVKGCGPFRSEAASPRDCESRRSWAAMKAAVLGIGDGGGSVAWGTGSGVVCVRVRARSSMEWLRRACRLVSGARWIGRFGPMVYVWCGRVRSLKERVYIVRC